MSIASLLYRKNAQQRGTKISGSADIILLDVTVSEQPSFRNRVSTHVIEDGSIITDHVTSDPDVLTLEGIISDAPASLLANIRDLQESGIGLGNSSRSLEAFELIKKLRDDKEVITITTGLTVYNDMVIIDFSPRRSATTGKALRFTMTLQRIAKVQSRLIKIEKEKVRNVHPNTKQQLQSKVDAGKQPTIAPTAVEETRTSFFYSTLQSIGVLK